MSLDRVVWRSEFTRVSRLPWSCPTCNGARLAVQEGTLHDGQTGASAEAQGHGASEPEWIDGRFACMLVCGNCRAEIALAGSYRVQDDRHLDEAAGETG